MNKLICNLFWFSGAITTKWGDKMGPKLLGRAFLRSEQARDSAASFISGKQGYPTSLSGLGQMTHGARVGWLQAGIWEEAGKRTICSNSGTKEKKEWNAQRATMASVEMRTKEVTMHPRDGGDWPASSRLRWPTWIIWFYQESKSCVNPTDFILSVPA